VNHGLPATKTTYLSLPAKLNVNADKLADLYLRRHLDPLHYNRAHHFPTTCASLENVQGTITGQYKTEIRDVYSSWPKLRTSLEKPFHGDISKPKAKQHQQTESKATPW
jgi:hypothetical protein